MKKTFFILILTSFIINASIAQTWSPVGGGIGKTTEQGSSTFVSSFIEYNGELYVAGRFDTANGIPLHSIAKLSGPNWLSVGGGLNSQISIKGITSMTIYNGELYVAGLFDSIGNIQASNIAKWNGASWAAIGNVMHGWINSLIVFNNELYAGGSFDSAGGIAAKNIARWNGANWDSVSSGINGHIYSFATYNAELYTAGDFSSAGGIITRIAKWNGTNWSAGPMINSGCDIYPLGVYNGDLCFGGLVCPLVTGNITDFILGWSGANWSNVGDGIGGDSGSGILVRSMIVYNNNLYVSGLFDSAGTFIVNNIAKLVGTNWIGMGTGLTGNPPSSFPKVNALCVFNGDLYVGGTFDSAGTIVAHSIARWNSPVGIDEISSSGYFNIFPNPSTAEINFSFNTTSGKMNLSILNILGQEIFSKTLSEGEQQYRLSQKFAAGIYTAVLKDNNTMLTKKLCIQ